METFSLSLFVEAGWGAMLYVALFIGLVLAGLAAATFVVDKIEDVAPGPVKFVVFIVTMLGVPMAVFWVLPGSHGEIVGLSEAEVDGERVVFGSFTWMAGGGRGAAIRHNAVRTFEVRSGRMLGSLHTRGGFFARGCDRRTWTNGYVRVCLDGPLPVRDAVTYGRLGTLAPTIDERIGAGTWRVHDTTETELVVEHKDGTQHRFAFAQLLDTPVQPREFVPIGLGCTVSADRPRNDVPGLLRASGCSLGGDTIALHRDAAFGAAQHQLSWVRQDGSVKWTTSLTPWLGPGTDELQLLDPRRTDEGLAVWLVRREVSLVEIVFDPADGTPVRSDVVF